MKNAAFVALLLFVSVSNAFIEHETCKIISKGGLGSIYGTIPTDWSKDGEVDQIFLDRGYTSVGANHEIKEGDLYTIMATSIVGKRRKNYESVTILTIKIMEKSGPRELFRTKAEVVKIDNPDDATSLSATKAARRIPVCRVVPKNP